MAEPEINLGPLKIDEQTGDFVIEDQNGNTIMRWDESEGAWTLNNNPIEGISSLSTEQLSVGPETAEYWPMPRQRSADLDDDTPPTSYATATLSSLPADAQGAYIHLTGSGDGTANTMVLNIRENGSSRNYDLEALGWAGHGDFTTSETGFVPVNSNNEIEYKTAGNTDRIFAYVLGYY